MKFQVVLFAIASIALAGCERATDEAASATAGGQATAGSQPEASPPSQTPGERTASSGRTQTLTLDKDAIVDRLAQGVTQGIAAVATAGDVDDPSAPLPDDVRARFAAIRSDPDPANLVRESHYWVSNEWAQYVLRPRLEGRGGVLVGVGTDQVYMFAAWAKSSIVVPLDFDRAITRLHAVYGILFEHADSPEAFRELWKERHQDEVLAWIDARYPDDDAERQAVREAYLGGRREVAYRLGKLARKYGKLGVPTFVSDPDEYTYVRQLWRNGRVFPVCGDLTADVAMVDVARAARDSGLDIRVLYLSNAEVYFEYGPTFRRNIVVQPFSEDSLVVRTRQLGLYGLPEPEDYHYNVQPGRNFAGWMAGYRGATTIGRLLDHRRDTDTVGLSIVDKPPIFNDRPPELAALPAGFELPPWAVPPDDTSETPQ